MSQTWLSWNGGVEPGRQVVALGLTATLCVVAINLVLVGELSFFYDLCFVAICLGLAAAVRTGDFFSVGVLPPLIMGTVVFLLAVLSPASVAEADDSLVQAVVSGLAHHSGALVAGYAVCLGTLAARHHGLLRDLAG